MMVMMMTMRMMRMRMRLRMRLMRDYAGLWLMANPVRESL